MPKRKIGMELRLLRTERGLSLKKVAENLGISENYLSQIETNKKVPSDTVIKKLAEFFSLDEGYLFKSFGKIPSEVKEEITNSMLSETLYKISTDKRLSDDKRERILKQLEKLYKEALKE